MKTCLSDINFTDVTTHYYSWKVPIITWGSCEPHGEHLPYATDGLLANIITYESVEKTGLENIFMVLPPICFGSQNVGQTNKRFCLHVSSTTQLYFLRDIVRSLVNQSFHCLVIINGHNGNDFKLLVRDIENEFPGFKIYVCNYLSVLDKEKTRELVHKKLDYEDDHAGFTETALMMYYYDNLVDTQYIIKDDSCDKKLPKKDLQYFWTPRDFDIYAYNTRIGYAGEASAKDGKILSEYITDEISSELIKISKEV